MAGNDIARGLDRRIANAHVAAKLLSCLTVAQILERSFNSRCALARSLNITSEVAGRARSGRSREEHLILTFSFTFFHTKYAISAIHAVIAIN